MDDIKVQGSADINESCLGSYPKFFYPTVIDEFLKIVS